MNSQRMSYVMIASLVVLTLGIIGCTYMANSMLETRAKILSDLKVKDEVLNQEKISLIKAKKDVATYTPLEKIAETIVPQDKDQAQTIREIVNIAAASGITPSSITFPNSNLAGTSSTLTTPSTSKGITQLTPVKGTADLYVLPITISQSATNPVSYTRFVTFLSNLEQNRRTAQVSNISLQPDAKDRTQLSFTLIVNQYIKP